MSAVQRAGALFVRLASHGRAQVCWMPGAIAARIFAISLSTSFFRYSGERSSRGATFATISLNRLHPWRVEGRRKRPLSLRTIGSSIPGKNRPKTRLTSNQQALFPSARQARNSGERLGCRMAGPLTELASTGACPPGPW